MVAICSEPDGRNINLNCGALHLEGLQQAVLAHGAEFGVAFDGDADRAIFVSPRGKVVNGDAVLLAAGRALKAAGRLPGDIVVSTVMSNLGLEKALEREGIRMVRTPVGDKYVLEEMVRLGAALGGEQSGHVIFREYATTGDGMLTALRLFEIARQAGVGLDELTADLQIYPQKLVNVRVREKKGLTGGAGGGARRSAWRRRRSPAPAACWCVSPAPNRWRASWWRVPTWSRWRRSAAISPTPSAARWVSEWAFGSSTATITQSRCRRATSSRSKSTRCLRALLAADGVYDLEPAPLADAADHRTGPRSRIRRTRFWTAPSAPRVMRRIGFPWSPELVRRTLASVGGTLAASRDALTRASAAIWPAARTTHSAPRARDSACSTIWPWRSRTPPRWPAARAAVIDLDVHQGDGTAAIFEDDPEVLTVSMHGENNFPFRKQRSRIDVALPDGTGDARVPAPAARSVTGSASPSVRK